LKTFHVSNPIQAASSEEEDNSVFHPASLKHHEPSNLKLENAEKALILANSFDSKILQFETEKAIAKIELLKQLAQFGKLSWKTKPFSEEDNVKFKKYLANMKQLFASVEDVYRRQHDSLPTKVKAEFPYDPDKIAANHKKCYAEIKKMLKPYMDENK